MRGVSAAAFYPPDRAAHVRQDPPRDLTDWHRSVCSIHSDAPRQRPNNGDDEAEMKSGPDTRNCRRSSDPTNGHRTRLHKALVLHVSDPAKVVAQKIEASHRTVESHRQQVPESWAALVNYCRAYPAFGLEVLELMGLDIDRDRESYATFLQLQKQVRGE